MKPSVSPQPLPIPTNAQIITPGTPVTLQPDDSPLYLKYQHKGGWFGAGGSVTVLATSGNPFNLGIYGPNPTVLSGATGRTRAPKLNTMPDVSINQCKGNFTSGTYYLVFRSGPDGPPPTAITVRLSTGWWNVFG